ncbi:hypothetical protein [Oligoflexus tunisiensis]|uniref:hypothetical protein n=1 Tax=Oligoflexus tunisiensis TaxID=708132 RepID=UPI00114D2B3E|nr:hypothetical protein [Oligoflexus tunisiensis]
MMVRSGVKVNLALLAVLVVSCSKKSDDEGKGGTMSTMALGNALAIEDESLGLQRNMQLLGVKAPQLVTDSSEIFGHSLADGITALKYRISSMELCGRSDGSTGDACNERPFSLFSSQDFADYDTFVPTDPSAASFTGWTDFMTPGSLKDLVGTVSYTDTHVGTYEAVIVNFFRTFKVNAKVLLNNGETLYTKNVTEFYSNNKTGLDVTYAGKSTTMTEGPSEEGLFFLPNGGKTFFLQHPFEITEDDLKNEVPYKMVLAFDHANFIKGAAQFPNTMDTNTSDWVEGQIDDAKGRRIAPGFLEFAPILARESETVMRETYILSTNGIPGTDGSLGNQPFSARVTFYYVKEDPTQAIRGVTSMAYYNEYSTSYLNFNPVGQIRSIKDGSTSGTIDVLQGYSGVVKLFKDFKRLTTVGESGTVSGEACMSGFDASGCSVPVQNVDWVYTYVGSAEAEAELSIKAVQPPPPTEDGGEGAE